MERSGISTNATARCAVRQQEPPLTLPRLCRVLVFDGSQVKARFGRTKSQADSGAIFVRIVGVQFRIACGAPKWFGFQPVCSMNLQHQGFLYTSTQHPPRHGSKYVLSSFDWRRALRAWNHLTNCCSTSGPAPDAYFAALQVRRYIKALQVIARVHIYKREWYGRAF